MEAGRSSPRYQNMALLFPQSKKLQANLTEYYIVVVKLCQKILHMSQNSSFMQLWDSFGDSLQDFQSQLKTWSTAIKDEVLIQSIVLTKEEKDDSSRFRVVLQTEQIVLGHGRCTEKLSTSIRKPQPRNNQDETYCETTRCIPGHCPTPSTIQRRTFLQEYPYDATSTERLRVDLTLDLQSI